ncbi:hypothetical protein F8388_027142 [Cannabis sativa]|uniref:Uncharacterized protein n=1 Tax=Cannabis sativa TaxID=3483 RepID=A0A7J6FRP7_CANSA|nr:hypothetical protein F8388_027142 [Cannabis sativa]KAF4399682.1 hypothetical protein G4B88_022765 [Cannabis sativa]
MSSKQGGKAKPLKQPKKDQKDYDEANILFKLNFISILLVVGSERPQSQGTTEGSFWRFRAQEKWEEIRGSNTTIPMGMGISIHYSYCLSGLSGFSPGSSSSSSSLFSSSSSSSSGGSAGIGIGIGVFMGAN